MAELVLSLFSGLGSLDEGFREAGYCVVSAGDVAYSSLYDVRRFHPPEGVFDGVIGGDPCQSHSTLANLVRAKGLEPSFPDMTPEFQRVIEEARPRWFLRENVPKAPAIQPEGYDVRSFLLDHSTMDAGDGTGHEQMRRRRFWFGTRDQAAPELRAFIDFALFVLPEPELSVNTAHDHLDGAEKIVRRRHHAQTGGGAWVVASAGYNKATRQAVTADQRDGHGALGGSGKLKRTTTTMGRKPLQTGGKGIEEYRRKQSVTGPHEGALRTAATKDRPEVDYSARYSLDEMLELQGLPKEIFDHSPLTVQGKRKLIGNAVPLPMARALANAVRQAMKP